MTGKFLVLCYLFIFFAIAVKCEEKKRSDELEETIGRAIEEGGILIRRNDPVFELVLSE